MKGCQKQKNITGSVQEKNGYLYLSLNLYVNGKRKPKMINTGLTVKGYHQREANAKLKIAKEMLNTGSSLEAVCDVVEGEAFRRRPKEEKAEQPAVEFLVQEVLDKFGSSLPQQRSNGAVRPRERGKWRGDTTQVAEYFRSWAASFRTFVKPNTFESYETQLNKRILPYWERFDITLSELEPYDIKTFYNYCMAVPQFNSSGKEISSSTLRRVHSVVHKALNDAVDEKVMKFNPASSVKVPKNNTYLPIYYTETQVRNFLEAVKGDVCEIPLVIAFFYGFRRSETLGLKDLAIDFDADQITIRHTVVPIKGGLLCQDIVKTKKSYRTLPLMPEIKLYLTFVLKRHADLREEFGPSWNSAGYICVADDGKLLLPNRVSKHYKMVAKKAGTPVNRLHDARHTTASMLVKSGTNLRLIQEWLGHSDIHTTERYTHLNTNDLIAPSNKIAQVMHISVAV